MKTITLQTKFCSIHIVSDKKENAEQIERVINRMLETQNISKEPIAACQECGKDIYDHGQMEFCGECGDTSATCLECAKACECGMFLCPVCDKDTKPFCQECTP